MIGGVGSKIYQKGQNKIMIELLFIYFLLELLKTTSIHFLDYLMYMSYSHKGKCLDMLSSSVRHNFMWLLLTTSC